MLLPSSARTWLFLQEMGKRFFPSKQRRRVGKKKNNKRNWREKKLKAAGFFKTTCKTTSRLLQDFLQTFQTSFRGYGPDIWSFKQVKSQRNWVSDQTWLRQYREMAYRGPPPGMHGPPGMIPPPMYGVPPPVQGQLLISTSHYCLFINVMSRGES